MEKDNLKTGIRNQHRPNQRRPPNLGLSRLEIIRQIHASTNTNAYAIATSRWKKSQKPQISLKKHLQRHPRSLGGLLHADQLDLIQLQ
jgi:hypothetical protein